MGQMTFRLRRWRPHVRKGLLPIIMLHGRGFLFALHLCAGFFLILTIWGSVRIEQGMAIRATFFGWKPPLTNLWPRHFTNQRSTSHATQSCITHPGSSSCSAVVWCSCWPGVFWRVREANRPAALTRFRYATRPNYSVHLTVHRNYVNNF